MWKFNFNTNVLIRNFVFDKNERDLILGDLKQSISNENPGYFTFVSLLFNCKICKGLQLGMIGY